MPSGCRCRRRHAGAVYNTHDKPCSSRRRVSACRCQHMPVCFRGRVFRGQRTPMRFDECRQMRMPIDVVKCRHGSLLSLRRPFSNVCGAVGFRQTLCGRYRDITPVCHRLRCLAMSLIIVPPAASDTRFTMSMLEADAGRNINMPSLVSLFM